MPHPDILQKPSETANAAIANELDEILRKRRQSAGRLTNTVEALERSAKRVETFRQAAACLEHLSQSDQKKLFCSLEISGNFERCMQAAADCQKKLRQAADTFRGLAVRFQRDTVNLGVIGLMGAGKSLFLQSLSSLPNEFIPSADGPSCTGVTCVIENVPGQSCTEVFFTFKDEEMVQEEINQELQYLWQKITGKTDGPRLTAPDTWQEELSRAFQAMKRELDARKITMGDLFKSWKIASNIYHDQWGTWRPLVYPTKPKRESGAETLSGEEWQKLLEQWQERMAAWEAGLKPYPLKLLDEAQWARDGAPRCMLTDLHKIRSYITKHSVAGEGNTEIYHHHCYHITIREAHIRTAFAGVDARICLIDTVGIGDKSTDTRDRMNRAIDVDSDGLIFIHKYPGCREYQAYEEMDRLSEICGERNSRRPGDWMAYLINAVPKKDCGDEWIINTFDPDIAAASLQLSENTLNPLKVKECAAALKDYTQGLFDDACAKDVFSKDDALNPDGRYIRLRYTANVGDSNAVTEFLNRFLRQISQRLEQIDAARMKDAETMRADAERAKWEFDRLVQMLNIPSRNDLELVSKLMDDKQAELRQTLSSYYRNGLHPELVSPLTLFQNKLEAMVNDSPDAPCKLKNLVQAVWAEHMPDWRRTQLLAMERLYREIRKIAAASSPGHIQAEQDFKKTVAEYFVKKLGIDLTKLANLDELTKRPLLETDETFFQDVKTPLFQKTDAGDLPQFFDALYHFHLNDSTVMAKAILTHVAAEHLCTYTVQGALDEDGKPSGSPQSTASDAHPKYAPPGSYAQPAVDRAEPVLGEESKVLEIEKNLRLRLQLISNDLKTYQTVEASYCISPQARLQEELIHFTMCFGEPYQKTWMLVFYNLYRNGVILQGEMDDFQRIRNVGEQLQHYINEYRNDHSTCETVI